MAIDLERIAEQASKVFTQRAEEASQKLDKQADEATQAMLEELTEPKSKATASHQ